MILMYCMSDECSIFDSLVFPPSIFFIFHITSCNLFLQYIFQLYKHIDNYITKFLVFQTSLLHAILKELPLTSGSIMVEGSISYASQEPWLFTGSVRKNILFGQSMDRHRYKEVVRVCALERDFQLFPHGDRTIVGERGVTLSGGQRARINLARYVKILYTLHAKGKY